MDPNNGLNGSLWSDSYKFIYAANSILEGLNSSSLISSAVNQQLTGEAKFIRAFCHFYLVNLFGDVPLILNTDYRVNAAVSRTPKAEVRRRPWGRLAPRGPESRSPGSW